MIFGSDRRRQTAAAGVDTHPELPVDPDLGQTDQSARPVHAQPLSLLLVFLGGAVGTLTRYKAALVVPASSGGWPDATLTVNLIGAFVLGVLLEELAGAGTDSGWRQRTRLLLGTGFCGGFTTYSTFAVEVALLLRDHAGSVGALYALTTVVGGLLASVAGVALAARHQHRELTRVKP